MKTGHARKHTHTRGKTSQQTENQNLANEKNNNNDKWNWITLSLLSLKRSFVTMATDPFTRMYIQYHDIGLVYYVDKFFPVETANDNFNNGKLDWYFLLQNFSIETDTYFSVFILT